MFKISYVWIAACAIAYLIYPFSSAQALDFKCGSTADAFPMSVAATVPAVATDWPRRDAAAAGNGLILAQGTAVQGTTVQGTVQRSVRLPARVPAGKTYAIQREGQRSFEKFSSGAELAQTDCAQIPCPKSFEPGTVCWKCVESITAE